MWSSYVETSQFKATSCVGVFFNLVSIKHVPEKPSAAVEQRNACHLFLYSTKI